MEMVLGPIFSLIPLLVLAGVVYLIVYYVRRGDRLQSVDPGIGTVRRLYFYSVSFVALMMAANGVVQILQYLLEALSGDDVVSQSQTRLAVGMSLTLVGLPLWFFHWRMVQRYVGELPVETHSVIRKLYVYLVLAVAVGFIIAASVGLLEWAFRTRSFGGFPWAVAIVWPAVWAFHWRLEDSDGQPTRESLAIRRLYLYLVALAMLIMAALGLGRVIHVVLLEGYSAVASLPVLLPSESGLWRDSMRTALATALVGSVAWAAQWVYFAGNDVGSALRQLYLYVFAILGGLVTALVSLGLIIFGVLAWLLGAPPEETSATHFRFLPGGVASLSIGGGLWAYHWLVARGEAESSTYGPQAARRAYAYILAALGLVALVVAAGALVNMALTLITEGSRQILAGEELWQKPLALSLTLGILGAPLWGYYWASIQRRVSAAGTEERASPARRIFMFAVLGVGMLALVGTLSALIFLFFRDVLGDGLSRETLRDAKPALVVVVGVAIFLPYHWLVYRRDRLAELEAAPTARERRLRKAVSVLVNEGGESFVRDLEAALGYEVGVLHWADPDASQPELSEGEHEELAQRISDAAGRNVLLVPDGTAVRVLSYD